MKRIVVEIPSIKPRNPVTCAARKRRAGTHSGTRASERQAGRRQLRAELSALRPPP